MIKVKQGTKQAESILFGYKMYASIRNSGIYGLYARPSQAKIRAYDDCIRNALKFGTILDVTGTGNSFNFTLYIGVRTPNGDIIIQETSSNTRILEGVEL